MFNPFAKKPPQELVTHLEPRKPDWTFDLMLRCMVANGSLQPVRK